MHAETRKYNAGQAPGDRAICRLLAEQIDRGLPDAENKIWHAHPVWFLEGNPIVGYGKLKDCVRLLFWSGQSFEEKGLRKEGSFKAAEARYTAVDQVDTAKLGRWLAEAREVQWDYKNLIRRKGRLERLEEKGRPSRAGDGPGNPTDGFTQEERAAMKERARELKAESRARTRADGEGDLLARIAEMPEPDRAMATRLHAVVKASAPGLSPKTWYGMPAYAGKDGKIVCFFQSAHKFKARYATFGFNDAARLDDGAIWPTAFALKRLTAEAEARIAALVKKAAG